jgi:5-methylthioadenosine/S-adenosylhomocysteine deaminase
MSPQSQADWLIHNALVLTLEAGTAPIVDGYVTVRGGKIAAVGREKASGELPPSQKRLDAGGSLVMPGLVNTHCHAPMVWFRGLADDLALQEWLKKFIFPAETGWLNRERVYWGALLAAAEMIRAGTTTVADGYFYETEVRRALAAAGLRAVAAQGVVDFLAPGVPDPRDNLKAAAEFIDSGSESAFDRITSTLFCHSAYTCGPETLEQAKDLTRSRALPFFIHLAETRQEVQELRHKTGLKPVFYLDRLGLLDGRTVAVHGVWLDPDEQDLLAERGVKVSHCPESNLKLAAGVAPVPELLARGVAVGLGTDGAASNNNLDLWGEMSLAARLHKVWRRDPTVLPAAQTAALATREGARVLGLEDEIGTLTPGKAADLIVVDMHQPHLTPLFDPFSHLVYAARPADVLHVMVAGRWLLKNRQFTTLDWPAIRRQIHADSHTLAAFCQKQPGLTLNLEL